MKKTKKTNTAPSLGTPKLGKPKAKVSVKKLKAASKKLGKKAKTEKKSKVIAKGPTGRPRTNDYSLPKPKEASPAKMDAQLKRLHERKLVSPKLKTLIGTVIVKHHRDRKSVIVGTKKGWFVKRGPKPIVGKHFTQLYGVACNLVNGPRDPYLFFKDELKKLKVKASA